MAAAAPTESDLFLPARTEGHAPLGGAVRPLLLPLVCLCLALGAPWLLWTPADEGARDIPLFESPALPRLPNGELLRLITSDGRDGIDVGATPTDTDGEGGATLPEYNATELPCGAELWPASGALIRWLQANADSIANVASMIELGAGTGVCGLFAAGLGARRVLLTDRLALAGLMRANVERNHHAIRKQRGGDDGDHSGGNEGDGGGGAMVAVATLDWNQTGQCFATDAQLRGPFDLVIGSDLTGLQDLLDALAETIATLVGQQEPPPRVILAHEHRSTRRDFGRALDGRWDAHDDSLAQFRAALGRRGLLLSLLDAERPVGEVRGGYRRWTADLSIVEVTRARRDGDAGVSN